MNRVMHLDGHVQQPTLAYIFLLVDFIAIQNLLHSFPRERKLCNIPPHSKSVYTTIHSGTATKVICLRAPCAKLHNDWGQIQLYVIRRSFL